MTSSLTKVVAVSSVPVVPRADEAPAAPKFPKAVFFVLGTELCERFSFYGMRAVLILYLTRNLKVDEESTKKIYHGFNMFVYFFPFFGGLLADMYLGKFKTIFYVSLIYASGNVFLSMVTVPQIHLNPKLPLAIVALALIAIGAGGIKPCVASFGGDQFIKGQETMRDKFFSIFYFCINVGAALSMILSPIFRADVSCLGDTECYPLAFGFPALLMVIATVIFVLGKPLYQIFPPNGTAVVDTVRCIWHALAVRCKATEKKPHWLDYADDKYDPSYIQDVRTVLSVLLLFVPLPMFWALFDQQGSTWTLQSAKLDGRLTDTIEIHPDQMDSMNAILVVVFIPIFTFLLYPMLYKCKLLRTPLQKMVTGGLLAAVSFLIGGFIQLSIEARLPVPPPSGTIDLMMINTVDCSINVKIASESVTLNAYSFHMFKELKTTTTIKGTLTFSQSCKNKLGNQTQMASSDDFEFVVETEKAYAVAIEMTPNGIIVGRPEEQLRKRDMSKANPFVRFVHVGVKPFPNASLMLQQEKLPDDSPDLRQQASFEGNGTFSDYAMIYPVFEARVCWTKTFTGNCSAKPIITDKISVYKGGIFEFLLIPVDNNTRMELVEMMAFPPDNIHILVQTPMYILITSGEVLLSISGLTFAYSEAPAGMKAVLQAAWLLTVAFGNVIVLIVIEIKQAVAQGTLESTFFFIFAGLMVGDMVLFAILAIRYKYKVQE